MSYIWQETSCKSVGEQRGNEDYWRFFYFFRPKDVCVTSNDDGVIFNFAIYVYVTEMAADYREMLSWCII